MHWRVFRGCEKEKLKLRHIPIVVTTVLEKKNDWPKLQEATAEPFFSMLTPRLLAFIISCIKSSNDESANQIDIIDNINYTTGCLISNCNFLGRNYSILGMIFWCLKYIFIYSRHGHFMIYHHFLTYFYTN